MLGEILRWVSVAVLVLIALCIVMFGIWAIALVLAVFGAVAVG